MASEMVERVARALCKRRAAYEVGPEDSIIDHDGKRVRYWTLWAEDALAAIAALREPTEAMMQAGMNVGSFPMCRGEVDVRWQAMIEAALKE